MEYYYSFCSGIPRQRVSEQNNNNFYVMEVLRSVVPDTYKKYGNTGRSC